MSRKKCHRKHWATGSAGVFAINKAIQRNNRSPLAEDFQRDIMLPAFAALEDLRVGKLTTATFVVLNEFNCMTWQMGRQVAIYRANDSTGDVAMIAKEHTEKAAEAFSAIGIRWQERGTFVPKAEELQAIRASFDLCTQLVALLPGGMILEAQLEGEKMVRGAQFGAAVAGASHAE